MDIVPDTTVTALDARRRRARRELDALVDSALRELAAFRAGNVVAIHAAYLDLTRAVSTTMQYGLDVEAVAS